MSWYFEETNHTQCDCAGCVGHWWFIWHKFAQLVENSLRWLMSFPSASLQKWEVGWNKAALERYFRVNGKSWTISSISLSRSEITSTSEAPASVKWCHRWIEKVDNSRCLSVLSSVWAISANFYLCHGSSGPLGTWMVEKLGSGPSNRLKTQSGYGWRSTWGF